MHISIHNDGDLPLNICPLVAPNQKAFGSVPSLVTSGSAMIQKAAGLAPKLIASWSSQKQVNFETHRIGVFPISDDFLWSIPNHKASGSTSNHVWVHPEPEPMSLVINVWLNPPIVVLLQYLLNRSAMLVLRECVNRESALLIWRSNAQMPVTPVGGNISTAPHGSGAAFAIFGETTGAPAPRLALPNEGADDRLASVPDSVCGRRGGRPSSPDVAAAVW